MQARIKHPAMILPDAMRAIQALQSTDAERAALALTEAARHYDEPALAARVPLTSTK
jgi:hypothetical protein